MSQRVLSPSVCRTGTRYLPKQTSLLLHFGFNLTGSSMPKSLPICYCLTCVWATDPAQKVTAFISLLLHHPSSWCCYREALPQHSVHTTDGLALLLLPRTPNMSFVQKFQTGTQHIGIITHLQCVTSPWAVPHSPLSQHEPHWHLTKARCKTLSEISDAPIPPAYYNQCRRRSACIYVYTCICITSYCSEQEVFSGLH